MITSALIALWRVRILVVALVALAVVALVARGGDESAEPRAVGRSDGTSAAVDAELPADLPVSSADRTAIRSVVSDVIAILAGNTDTAAKEVALAPLAAGPLLTSADAAAISGGALQKRFAALAESFAVVEVTSAGVDFDFTVVKLDGVWQVSLIALAAPATDAVAGVSAPPPPPPIAASAQLPLPLAPSELVAIARAAEDVTAVLADPALSVAQKNEQLASASAVTLVFDSATTPPSPAYPPRVTRFTHISDHDIGVNVTVGSDDYGLSLTKSSSGWKAQQVTSGSCAESDCQLRPDDGSYEPPAHDEH